MAKMFTKAKKNLNIIIPIGGIILVVIACSITGFFLPAMVHDIIAGGMISIAGFFGLGFILILNSNLNKFGKTLNKESSRDGRNEKMQEMREADKG